MTGPTCNPTHWLSGPRTTDRTPSLLGIMYRTVWLTYRQTIGASDYWSDPVITGYYASDSLINLPSDNRGVGLHVGPRHYWVLCIGQSDIRGVGPVNTGYYVLDSLTYVPSENRGVGLQVCMTTVVNQATIRSRPRRPHIA